MINTLKRITNSYNYYRGWTTNRKFVVIESDDWGAIRMPDRKVYAKLNKKYPNLFQSGYSKYDTIASDEDFQALYEALNEIRDIHNNPAIITANTITANPDFIRIRENKFEKYYFETFTETIKNVRSSRTFDLWKAGIKNKFFKPQLHGREHVNVGSWMRCLKSDGTYRDLFEQNVYAIDSLENKKNLTAALDYLSEKEKNQNILAIKEASNIFYKSFGFHSKSFIAPSYTWFDEIEEQLRLNNVSYIQGLLKQKTPDNSDRGFVYKRNYLGKKNRFQQIYLIRNVFFEPSLSKSTSEKNIADTLKRVEMIFRWKKPAIISSHRLNFIGGLVEKNRTENLAALKKLLVSIKKYWPEVEFITSDDLGGIIKKSFEHKT